MHLLLLEPDRLLAKTYWRMLAAAGHDVTVCAAAQQAIATADKQLPDLVVMELQLVAHSGIEFLYEFRSYADWMEVPIIINTNVPPAEFSGARDVLMHELGIETYLYKPQTSLNKLVREVNEQATHVVTR